MLIKQVDNIQIDKSENKEVYLAGHSSKSFKYTQVQIGIKMWPIFILYLGPSQLCQKIQKLNCTKYYRYIFTIDFIKNQIKSL